MNMGRLINMVINQILRRVVNAGINKGMRTMSKGQGATKSPNQPGSPSQAGTARDTAKRARQAARITRRLGR